ncbi:hypothetical protein [Vallitalea guaymasensis]|uniref:Uncharacterized protein n=1 Tax=Vallitalea guaymasensis TaxID=1185412 RepID=A0A8J8SBP7_9FIRM|nr:hypothetical protein [Vallitalea guaymasensis]QUH28630.1 hypothetical protein HYG85_06755 [Vallitalea guaymasensis]
MTITAVSATLMLSSVSAFAAEDSTSVELGGGTCVLKVTCDETTCTANVTCSQEMDKIRVAIKGTRKNGGSKKEDSDLKKDTDEEEVTVETDAEHRFIKGKGWGQVWYDGNYKNLDVEIDV